MKKYLVEATSVNGDYLSNEIFAKNEAGAKEKFFDRMGEYAHYWTVNSIEKVEEAEYEKIHTVST